MTKRRRIGVMGAFWLRRSAGFGVGTAWLSCQDFFLCRKAALPAGRIGTPDEVADAIAFLASEKVSYITGQILHVNGGKTAL